jgi:hypothetical protein
MIQNEARYNAAIERNIRNNARKTRRRKMMESDTGKLAHDLVMEQGEFAPKVEIDGVIYTSDEIDDHCWGDKHVTHPMVAALGSFRWKMLDVIDEWGGLTEAQAAAVVRIATENAARREERMAARREADLKSQHIGAVGERREFEITCNKTLEFNGRFGVTYLNICKQGDDVVIYKGSNPLKQGEAIRVKATIKAHDEREGVKQTIISRPKKI